MKLSYFFVFILLFGSCCKNKRYDCITTLEDEFYVHVESSNSLRDTLVLKAYQKPTLVLDFSDTIIFENQTSISFDQILGNHLGTHDLTQYHFTFKQNSQFDSLYDIKYDRTPDKLSTCDPCHEGHIDTTKRVNYRYWLNGIKHNDQTVYLH